MASRKDPKANPGFVTNIAIDSPDPNAFDPFVSPALLHANDAALGDYVVNDNKEMFIYVAAWRGHPNPGTNYLVKLEYTGIGAYWERARYEFSSGWAAGRLAASRL